MYEIVVHVHPDCEEAIVAFLETYHIQSAIRILTPDGERGISFYMGEKDWVSFCELLGEKSREVSEIFGVSLPCVTIKTLEDDSWKDAWKRYARIYRFGKELVVKPTWRKLRKQPGCPVISIDPQMAFGTGGHASTRLCIYQLLQLRKERPTCLARVLDVGTGSGILAIVAVLLGAKEVFATDIDPDAVRIARDNASRNLVASHVKFSSTPLHKIPGEYSLILANIYASVLSGLLNEFVKHLEPGGVLVVSGLMTKQGKEFAEKAKSFGLRKLNLRYSRSWVSYAFECQ